MKEIYIVDYLVHDHLGTDATSNYQRMQETKGPVDAIRYTPDDYPHVNCKKGFHMEYVDNNYTSYKLTVDLTNKIENLYGEQIPGESAVVFGSFGIGTKTRDEFNVSFLDGVRRFSPTKLFSSNHDLISALVAGKLKTTGVNTSINAACSSSMFNMHYASMLIETGQTPAAIVGAVDMTVEAKMQYYWQCTSAISTDSGGTCIPFDNKRDGFLQGEGGTAWYICDEETVKRHNLKPKAKLKSIVVGSKVTSMTAHDKTCENQIHLINQALKKAGLQASDISFFNAHATSTLVGDDIEVDVFQKVFENIDIPIVSFKGYIGHTMSACGLIESAYGLEALKAGYLHPNYNLTSPLSSDPRIITTPAKLSGKYFMKASFGFGGRTSIAIFESL